MKKFIYVAISFCLLLCFQSQAFSSCPDCKDSAFVEENADIELVNNIVNSALGSKMISVIEELGGKIQITNSKSVQLPAATLTLIPAGTNGDLRIDLLYLDQQQKGTFVFVVASYVKPFDFFNSYIKLYTASGKEITFKDFSVNISNSQFCLQKNDDINDKISILDQMHILDNTGCTVLLVLCIVTGLNILICVAYIIVCLV